MKTMYLRPFFLDVVNPIINQIDGDDDTEFNLGKLGGGGGTKSDEEESGKEEEKDKGDESGSSGKDGSDNKEDGKEDSGKEKDGSESDDNKDGDRDKGESEDGSDGTGDGNGEKGESNDSGDGSGEDDKGKTKGDDDSGKETDFFGDINEGKSKDDGSTPTDYSGLAQDLGIEMEDPKNKAEFVTKYNGQIKEAQQKFDLSEYNDSSKRLIEFAQKNGDLTAFFSNPKINQLNSFLSSTPEDKYTEVRMNQLTQGGANKEDATDTIEGEMNEMSTRELKDLVDGYDQQIKKSLNDEIVSIVGDKEKQIDAAREKAETEIKIEQKTLIDYVEKQDTFLGISLSDTNKKGIINAINNGSFDLAVEQDPAASKFQAFMFSKFYSKIVKHLEESEKISSRKSYKKGVDKGTSTTYHKDSGDGGAKGSSHKGQWSDLKDIDDDD